jgi:hypothetical protein
MGSRCLRVAVGSVLLAVVLPTATASAADSPWVRVRPPVTTGPWSGLSDVDAFSASGAWAVGSERGQAQEDGVPLVLRFTGRAWTRAVSPRVPWRGFLADVEASSDRDVWVAGYENPDYVPHLLHWNGLRWQENTPPGAGPYVTFTLKEVPGDRPWAYRSQQDGTPSHLFRWSGTAWADLGQVPAGFEFAGFDVTPDGTAWLLGRQADGLRVLRRDGDAWVEAAPPGPAMDGYTLLREPDGGFRVGGLSGDFPPRPTIAHWDGSAWSQDETDGYGPARLVPGRDGSAEWAYGPVNLSGVGRPTFLLRHRGDGTWETVDNALPSGSEADPVTVSGMAQLPGTDSTVAVGTAADVTGTRTLPWIEREDTP